MAFSLPHKSPLLQTKGISEPSKVPQVQLSVMLDLWTIVTSPTIPCDCIWNIEILLFNFGDPE